MGSFSAEFDDVIFKFDGHRLTVDRRRWGNTLQPICDSPIRDVQSIEFEQTKAAETKRRKGLIGLVSRQEVPARTGVFVKLTGQGPLIVEVAGAPIAVRAKLAPLVDAINQPQQSSGPRLSPADAADQIEHLVRLRDSGAITDDEYDAAKRKLLDTFG